MKALRLAALFAVTGANAQVPRGGSEVRGRVTDRELRPLASALVTTGGSLRPESLVTDSTGRFRFTGLARGNHGFRIRRVGFTPAEFEVEFATDTVVDVDVPLEMALTTLDTITVHGVLGPYERKLRFVGFEERRLMAERTATDATFITPEDIRRRQPFRLSHLLEGYRGFHIQYSASGLVAIPRGRNGCVMSIWIDGQVVQRGSSIGTGSPAASFQPPPPTSGDPARNPGLEIISVNEVAAVEVYPSPSGTPPEFQSMSVCGAVVVWTK